MVADAILDVTQRRDLVLDPFLGSGSTLCAAQRVGRRCRGLELDPRYVDLTIRRWQRMTGEAAVLERTGERFDDLASATVAEAGR
jgi:DNA modification methylase